MPSCKSLISGRWNLRERPESDDSVRYLTGGIAQPRHPPTPRYGLLGAGPAYAWLRFRRFKRDRVWSREIIVMARAHCRKLVTLWEMARRSCSLAAARQADSTSRRKSVRSSCAVLQAPVWIAA